MPWPNRNAPREILNLHRGAIPDYRALRPGEVIRWGDEIWTKPKFHERDRLRQGHCWEPVTQLLGRRMRPGDLVIRRPIAPVTGHDLVTPAADECPWCEGTKYTPLGILCRTCQGTGKQKIVARETRRSRNR